MENSSNCYIEVQKTMANEWPPITDLPADFSALTDGGLLPLTQFWSDQKTELDQIGQLQKFSQELAREWTIETGQIEGIYDIDRGTTRTLIERGINADLIGRVSSQQPPELVAAIIRSNLSSLAQKPLTASSMPCVVQHEFRVVKTPMPLAFI